MNPNPFFFMLLICCRALIASAAPADPAPFVYTQPDGRQFTLLLVGDERAHQYLTTDSLLVTIDAEGFVHVGQRISPLLLHQKLQKARAHSRRYRKALRQQREERFFNHPPRGLIILANFADNAFTFDREGFERMMNEEGYDGDITNDNATPGSARDYFIEQSSGQYQPIFDIVGPVTLDQPYSYYGTNTDDEDEFDQHPEEMIFTAVQTAVDEGLVTNLADYDHDGDGMVDMVYVIYAGKGENNGGGPDTIWPHMWDFRETGLIDATIQDLHFGLYACSAELNGSGERCGIGTFCHEFGHCLGLPDLYDVDYSGGNALGNFDIMASGSNNARGYCPPAYSAFERYSLGWLEYDELTTDGSYILDDLKTTNQAYRLSSGNPHEYFILENRRMTSWDAHIPAEGMLITHIDYDEEAWQENTVNDDPAHPRVSIVAADGRKKMTTFNAQDIPYPGRTGNSSFTDLSTPSSCLWDGTPLCKPVTAITENAGIISFDFADKTDGLPFLKRPAAASSRGFTTDGLPADSSHRGIIIHNQRKTLFP